MFRKTAKSGVSGMLKELGLRLILVVRLGLYLRHIMIGVKVMFQVMECNFLWMFNLSSPAIRAPRCKGDTQCVYSLP